MSKLNCMPVVLVLAVVLGLLAAGPAAAQPKIYWSTDTPMTVEVPAIGDAEQFVAQSRISIPLEEAVNIENVQVIVNWESNRSVLANDYPMLVTPRTIGLRVLLDADGVTNVDLDYYPTVSNWNCDAPWVWNNAIFTDATAPSGDKRVRTGFQGPDEPLSSFNGNSNATDWTLMFYLPSNSVATVVQDCGPAPMTLKSWGLIFNAPLTPATAQNTLAVPWFVDNSGPGQGNPPANGKMATYVFLHNNRPNTFLGFVEYYTENGIYIGPFDRSAFVIGPNATIAFRPVADDPVSLPKGQEAPPGQAVPNRPVNQDDGNDGKSNGSLVIRWFGDTGDLVGMAKSFMLNGFESSTLLPSAVPVGP